MPAQVAVLYQAVAPGPLTDQDLPPTVAPMQYVAEPRPTGRRWRRDRPESIDFSVVDGHAEIVPLSA